MDGLADGTAVPTDGQITEVTVQAITDSSFQADDVLQILREGEVLPSAHPSLQGRAFAPRCSARIETDSGAYDLTVMYSDIHVLQDPWNHRVALRWPAELARSRGPVSADDATRMAAFVSRRTMAIPYSVTPTIAQTETAFVVTFPMSLPEGTRGPDYYTQVTIERSSGEVTQLRVA